MLIRRVSMLFITLLLAGGTVLHAHAQDFQITSSKPGAKVDIDKRFEDDRVVVSVRDEGGKPVFGLGAGDFAVTQSGRKAEIVSVKPLAESLDVPRHFVLVLDNSYSMKERRAIYSLLTGVDELLKVVRPIDRVHLVVFRNFGKTNVRGYGMLSVETFESNDPGELRGFLANAYDKGITGKTVLYDAMLTGLVVMKNIPETEPRFMVVFSDGADLNSVYASKDVLNAARPVKGFSAYAIDFMPTYGTNDFLEEFAKQKGGRIWKAKSDNNLVEIFQEVASKMEYYYVVSYRFPPKGTLAAEPATLKFDEFRVSGSEPETRMDETAITLSPVVDSVYGIESWKATVGNSGGNVADISGEGAPAGELSVQLPSGDPQSLAAGGDLTVRMELLDKKGQRLVMDAPPVKVEVVRTTAGLTVTPDTLRFDEVSISGAEPETHLDVSALTLRPAVDSLYGIESWKAAVSNSGGTVAELSGNGAPSSEVKVPLPMDKLQALASGGDLSVKMELVDRKGHSFSMDAPPVKVEVMKSMASLITLPSAMTIEEIKTVDYSPMLTHIYFDKGSSVIPEKYVLLGGTGDTEGFDEKSFRGSMEKYYQVLNIIGKRLTDNPAATVTLVGCNDNNGEERGNKKLSTARAEAVGDYLQTVWSIAPERMSVEARNLPEKPSASRLEEGRAENRRVEIRSEDSAITMPIQSDYFTYRTDTPALTVQPVIASSYGIASWHITVSNGQGKLAEFSGEGLPQAGISVPTDGWDLEALPAGGDIAVDMELLDQKGRTMNVSAEPVVVNLIRTSQLRAKKEGMRVQEKYALILFDFDKSDIGPQNQKIIDSIAARAMKFPESTMEIVGHSDNIGKESYNIKLSERRALSAYKMLKAAFEVDPGERMQYTGVGPNNPLYDNLSPEARSFNRTVTVTLEYMSLE